ncbi:MAG: hypothetical protein PHG23_03780 [Candidatus Pacebacteria bacterium]|nr:hypothetical protein [Candidatus Paceibacterota bacterium]
MSNFYFPIERPKDKKSFAASQIRRKGADGKEIKLGDKESPPSNPLFTKRPLVTKENEGEYMDKYKQMIQNIKADAKEKDSAPVKEDSRLRFYKVTFPKKNK